MKTSNQEYQVLEKIRSDDDCILQRALYDESTILILTAKNQRQSAKLENEFELRGALDPAWALIPFELRGVEPNKSLLFNDHGDSLLTQRLKEKLDMTRGIFKQPTYRMTRLMVPASVESSKKMGFLCAQIPENAVGTLI